MDEGVRVNPEGAATGTIEGPRAVVVGIIAALVFSELVEREGFVVQVRSEWDDRLVLYVGERLCANTRKNGW